MVVGSFKERMEEIRTYRPSEWQDNDAVNVGLSLILSDAACSHIQRGDLGSAILCVVEAEWYLDLLRPGRSS